MKQLFILLLLISSIGYSQENKELFDDFIKNFEDKEFQLDRIKFPVEMTSIDKDTFEEVNTEITKEDWTHTHFYQLPLLNGQDAYPQLYDNFERQLRDTDERVFSWKGYTDLNVNYFFKRIEGKWYLIKIEDFSI